MQPPFDELLNGMSVRPFFALRDLRDQCRDKFRGIPCVPLNGTRRAGIEKKGIDVNPLRQRS